MDGGDNRAHSPAGADDKHVLNPESLDLCALHGFAHNTLRYGRLFAASH